MTTFYIINYFPSKIRATVQKILVIFLNEMIRLQLIACLDQVLVDPERDIRKPSEGFEENYCRQGHVLEMHFAIPRGHTRTLMRYGMVKVIRDLEALVSGSSAILKQAIENRRNIWRRLCPTVDPFNESELIVQEEDFYIRIDLV